MTSNSALPSSETKPTPAPDERSRFDLTADEWAQLPLDRFAEELLQLSMDLCGHEIENDLAITAILASAADRLKKAASEQQAASAAGENEDGLSEPAIPGWVITRPDRSRWLGWNQNGPFWTRERSQALAFARWHDAKQVVLFAEDGYRWQIVPI